MTAVPSGWSPEQARKRLEAATQGPWERANASNLPDENGPVIKDLDNFDWVATVQVPNVPQWSANAALIANAPTDIAALLALLDDAREILEPLAGRPDALTDKISSWLARFAADKDSP